MTSEITSKELYNNVLNSGQKSNNSDQQDELDNRRSRRQRIPNHYYQDLSQENKKLQKKIKVESSMNQDVLSNSEMMEEQSSMKQESKTNPLPSQFNQSLDYLSFIDSKNERKMVQFLLQDNSGQSGPWQLSQQQQQVAQQQLMQQTKSSKVKASKEQKQSQQQVIVKEEILSELNTIKEENNDEIKLFNKVKVEFSAKQSKIPKEKKAKDNQKEEVQKNLSNSGQKEVNENREVSNDLKTLKSPKEHKSPKESKTSKKSEKRESDAQESEIEKVSTNKTTKKYQKKKVVQEQNMISQAQEMLESHRSLQNSDRSDSVGIENQPVQSIITTNSQNLQKNSLIGMFYKTIKECITVPQENSMINPDNSQVLHQNQQQQQSQQQQQNQVNNSVKSTNKKSKKEQQSIQNQLQKLSSSQIVNSITMDEQMEQQLDNNNNNNNNNNNQNQLSKFLSNSAQVNNQGNSFKSSSPFKNNNKLFPQQSQLQNLSSLTMTTINSINLSQSINPINLNSKDQPQNQIQGCIKTEDKYILKHSIHPLIIVEIQKQMPVKNKIATPASQAQDDFKFDQWLGTTHEEPINEKFLNLREKFYLLKQNYRPSILGAD